MYFSEFLSYCYVALKSLSSFESDSQPVELEDEYIKTNHSKCSLPDNVPLMLSKEKLKCWKVKAQYHQPNPNKDIEKYAHHLLFSFSPFRDEQELKSQSFSESFKNQMS